jgi:5'-deoxynucleotidase YfbR-like HD superfamily hydrolase
MINDLMNLASLALAFGRVDRVTFHPDSETRESDTDHTVMLALMAPALAARLRPDLNPELIAAFAVVHDLVEVKTGDTDTFGISSSDRADKAEREAAALAELREELSAFPWIVDMLDRYEAQDEPAARWTRIIDKILPKLTHALNCGATLRLKNKPVSEIRIDGERQRDELRAQYPEFPEAIGLLWQAVEAAEMACSKPPTNDRTRPRRVRVMDKVLGWVEPVSPDVWRVLSDCSPTGPAWGSLVRLVPDVDDAAYELAPEFAVVVPIDAEPAGGGSLSPSTSLASPASLHAAEELERVKGLELERDALQAELKDLQVYVSRHEADAGDAEKALACAESDAAAARVEAEELRAKLVDLEKENARLTARLSWRMEEQAEVVAVDPDALAAAILAAPPPGVLGV